MIAHESIPALIALVFKFVLLAYAINSPARNATTRLYLTLLVLLSLQNLVEFFGLNYLAIYGLTGVTEIYGYVYTAFIIPVAVIILHISLRISFTPDEARESTRYLSLLYIPAVFLVVLLLGSDRLIMGFERFHNSILRKPGDWFFLLEGFVVLCWLVSFVILAYGARKERVPVAHRTRNRLWLLALSPMLLLLMYLVVANHFHWTELTWTFYVPLAMTFFLIVTTYATHQYRLLDIEFYIPWSKVRKRKTAFYDRIRALISEIADLVSVREVINRLSDTLHCPVALVGGPTPIAASGSNKIIDFPINQLRAVDSILVANEIADATPETHALMKRHGVAAIVPFYPHSENAASWLLLGDSFSEQVYTRLDFRVVEELFDKMADLFLDKLLAIRTQLADAHLKVQTLEYRIQTLEAALSSVHERVEVLSRENTRLQREQPADSLIEATARTQTMAAITLLGRNKEMLKRLRESFPQVEHFAGPESTSFRRQPAGDLVICGLETESAQTERRLLAVLEGERCPRAVLFYGERARGFVFDNRKALLGKVIEVLPEHATSEALVRRVQALVELGRSLRSCVDHDYPLIGRSAAFENLLNETKRVAGLADPVFIHTSDAGAAIALAAYVHGLSGASGRFIAVSVASLGDEPEAAGERLCGLLAQAKDGTLMFDNLCAIPNAVWDDMVARGEELSQVRLVAACLQESGQTPDKLMRPFRPLVLDIPPLGDRHTDLALLVHYYTLQFNLQSGTTRYLTQADTEQLLGSSFSTDLGTLKAAVYARLTSKDSAPVSIPDVDLLMQDRSLDENVAEFELRLIQQTLKRCGGNKSKAARLLGLRPNTLHYKLERYGLLEKKR